MRPVKKRYIALSTLLTSVVFVLACISGIGDTWTERVDTPRPLITIEGLYQPGGGGGTCTLPPGSFQVSDLTGTWVAWHAEKSDTLILREDGYYKQILDVKIPEPYHYESDWQRWWVEDRGSGILYLHLEGMRLCVYSLMSDDCQRVGGGKVRWYDDCEQRFLEMPEEGILMVLGVPQPFVQPPRGIILFPMSGSPDWSGSVYHLQE